MALKKTCLHRFQQIEKERLSNHKQFWEFESYFSNLQEENRNMFDHF